MAKLQARPKPRVYIETSIVGHLASRLSRELVTAGHQQITHEWWDDHRQRYDLYISELVVQEAAGGDPNEAAKRLAALEGIPQAALTEECRSLAADCWPNMPYHANPWRMRCTLR